MGAHPYQYFVWYNPDTDAALQELREQEFRAGRYNPVIPHPQFPFPSEAAQAGKSPPGAQHKSIRHAVEAAGADGTRSILDLDRVSDTPEFNAVAPLPPEELQRLFGSERPTHEQIEGDLDGVFEGIENGQGVYIVVYRNDQPDELFFAGYSFD
ncbi:MAG TPA: hypothetical protein VJA21_28835 [Verrucomicrobiae bacterium]